MHHSFFYFYFYTLLRSLRPSPQSPSNSKSPTATASKNVLSELALGFVAGVASRAVSTPLNVVTLGLQTARDDDEEGERKDAGVMGVVRRIYKEEGLKGFWRGTSPPSPSLFPSLMTNPTHTRLRNNNPPLPKSLPNFLLLPTLQVRNEDTDTKARAGIRWGGGG
jgi:hypothetical protein